MAVTQDPTTVPAETGSVADVAARQQYLNTPINTGGSWGSFVCNFMSLIPEAQPSTSQYTVMFSGARTGHNNSTVEGVSSRMVTRGGASDLYGSAFWCDSSAGLNALFFASQSVQTASKRRRKLFRSGGAGPDLLVRTVRVF